MADFYSVEEAIYKLYELVPSRSDLDDVKNQMVNLRKDVIAGGICQSHFLANPNKASDIDFITKTFKNIRESIEL